MLRLAGVYDEQSMVPTLAQQMARVYERDLQSHLYAGSLLVGQSALHRDDMLDALQDALGQLMHGTAQWLTLRVPKPLAAAGAWVQGKLEPLVPDAIDGGEPPFIRPFMVAMADDLPQLVAALKADPAAWYAANGITAPGWITQAGGVLRAEPAHAASVPNGPPQIAHNPDALRTRLDMRRKAEHSAWRWAHRVNIGLGSWLLTQPLLVGVQEPWLRGREMTLGLLLMSGAALALSWRAVWARWLCAGIGAAVMAVPFLGSTANAAAYLSDTLVGAFVFGLAVCSKPEPGSSAVAALTGPSVPPGGYTYLLEILTGLVGSRQSWGTAPWVVLLFGLMIVPLGMTTILFIIIQPVVLGTWSTLALVGGAAVVACPVPG